ASERTPDQHARAQHDTEEPLRARHQREARDIKRRTDHHDAAEAVADRHGAGERLQESPGEILHCDGERELGDGDADVMRQRLHEAAVCLSKAHAEYYDRVVAAESWLYR